MAGTLLVSLGVALIGKANLITGGTAGLAFLLHYSSGISFGKLFFCLTLLGAVVLSLRLAISHRPGRYMVI